MTAAAAVPGRSRGRWSPASVAVGSATILTLVGIVVGLFFNPVWVAFEQGRTRAAPEDGQAGVGAIGGREQHVGVEKDPIRRARRRQRRGRW